MKVDIANLVFIDAKLRTILSWLEKNTGLEFTVTSTYRIGDEGVHGTLPVRGVDLRMRDRPLGALIETLVNSRWQYDPNRLDLKCALVHGLGSDMHLHLQVHPNTKRL